MTNKFFLLTIIALVSIFSAAFAQPQGKQSYNFTRAIEDAEKGNKANAVKYRSMELSDNPNKSN